MRYVIAEWSEEPTPVVFAAFLPDAEHIHVTRHPDGTITAVPMREKCRHCGCEREFHDNLDRRCGVCNDFCVYSPAWVDSPGGAA